MRAAEPEAITRSDDVGQPELPADSAQDGDLAGGLGERLALIGREDEQQGRYRQGRYPRRRGWRAAVEDQPDHGPFEVVGRYRASRGEPEREPVR